MARKLEVEILANVTGYTKGLVKAGEQTKAFAVGTVDESTKHIGRSLALMTGGFVAFAGAADLVTTSISAARDAEVAQRALATQMKASGESFTVSQAAIEKAGLSLSKFGFTVEDSEKALAVLDRATGSITKAIKLQGIAANLARAKNITLSQAALVLGKAYDGQTAGLKRLGVEIPKGVKGMQALWLVGKQYAGQAKANTTAAEQFSTKLHDTEVIIGTALLPTVNRLLTSLGDWLDKMNKSGQLQKDVNTAVSDGTTLFKDLIPYVEAAKTAFKDLGDVVGGTKTEILLLVGAFAAFKSAKVATSIADTITGVRRIGTSAATSTGEVTGLRGALSGLAGPAAIITGLLVAGHQLAGLYAGSGAQKFMDNLFGNTSTKTLTQLRAQAQQGGIEGAVARQTLAQLGISVSTASGPVGPVGTPFRPGAGLTGPVGVRGGANGPVIVRTAYTPEEKLQIALAQSPNNIGLLQQQAAHDRASIAFLQKLHAAGKGPSASKLAPELQGFYNDLNSQLSTIASIQAAAASKTAAARKKAADAAKKAAAEAKQDEVEARKMIARLIGRQHESPEQYVARAEKPGSFERLGPLMVSSYGESPAIQVALAREQALGKSQTQTLKAARAAAWRALRSGKLLWQAQKEAYDEITSVNQQLTKGTTDFVVKYRRSFRGTQPAYAGAGGGVVINGGLHLHGIQDMTQLENALEARAKRRPRPRRGR